MRRTAPKVVWYSEESEDPVGGKASPFAVPPDYVFIHRSPLWRAAAFIVYRLIMTPVAWIYCRFWLGLRRVDCRTRKPKRGQGCFLYANHTMPVGDAFAPSVLWFPKRIYVVVSPANLAVKGTRHFLQMVGALPIPENLTAFRQFREAVLARVREGHAVVIYPEAHVWPYYTGIRLFSARSFAFPVAAGAPVYVSTATFQKRRFCRRPRVTVYLDGPFYPDSALPRRQAEQALRDRVYAALCARSQNSTYRAVEYRKKEETP